MARSTASETTRDFFINQPKSLDVEGDFKAEPTNTTRRRTDVEKKADRRSERRVRKREKPNKKDELQLDLDRVREVESRRRVVEQAPVPRHDTTPWVTVFSIGGLGVVSFILATYLTGAIATPTSGVARYIVSLVPLLGATLWTGFTQLGVPTAGSFSDRWFLPTSLHMFYVFLMLVVSAFFIFPEHAAIATSESASWFTTQETGSLKDLGTQFGQLFNALFRLGDRLTPW